MLGNATYRGFCSRAVLMFLWSTVLTICGCVAVSPIPHILWRKVGATDLPAGHEISMSGALLHLYNVQYEDAGKYECEAINSKGKDWHHNWLYVQGKHLSTTL